jgi:predicted enzyme related to lactoylglutathione lyase
MAERTAYAPGIPCWVDLQTSDQAAAKRFYTALFGWGYDEQPMGDDAVYAMSTIRGKHAAAIAPLPPQQGIPPHWNTYVASADVDATTDRVSGAGGSVVMPPMDVMDAGRMAVIQDPTGAMICAWQAKNNIGSQVVNEAGAFTWSELSTSDVDKATAFYGKVFDWKTQRPFEGTDYTVLQNDDRAIGGAMKSPMEGMPSFWLVYFDVDDTDATVKTARDNGASIMVEPTDIPEVGRFAVITDPQGASFGVIKSIERAD